MKNHLIQKYFDTKSKADRALSRLGVTMPKTGGVKVRHELFMAILLLSIIIFIQTIVQRLLP